MKPFLFASALLLSMGVFAGSAWADFSDVDENNPHSVAIDALVEQGVLTGYDTGEFKPDQEVTRAEAVKIILLGLELEVDEESIAALVFNDVSEDDWFFSSVSTALTSGWIQGYDDGEFKPGQTVNRAEAMKILLEAASIEVDTVSSAPFPDVASEDWFAPYADYAREWNVEPAQSDGSWHADEAVTRATMAEMVYRLQQVQETGESFDESSNWLRQNFPTVDLTLKIPFGWYMKGDGVGAVWTLDGEHEQFTLLAPYANGATLLMTRYANTELLSSSELLSSLQSHLPYETETVSINGRPGLEVIRNEGVYYRDWYVVLDNDSLVHFVGMRGQGDYANYLEDYLEAMVNSVEYDGTDSSKVEDIVESLRTAIQVDGVGGEMMEQLEDWELIETDSIGVGTGPVDYYYSPSADITLKYERSFDVILAIETGETSAF